MLLGVERCVSAKFKNWYITDTHIYIYLRIYLLSAERLGRKGAVQVVVKTSNLSPHVQ